MSSRVDPPEVMNPSESQITVDYGGQFSLHCMTEGTVIKYSWLLNGTKLSDNTSTLQRDSATFTSGGTYQCYAYNEAGNDSFAIYVNIHSKMKHLLKFSFVYFTNDEIIDLPCHKC